MTRHSVLVGITHRELDSGQTNFINYVVFCSNDDDNDADDDGDDDDHDN